MFDVVNDGAALDAEAGVDSAKALLLQLCRIGVEVRASSEMDARVVERLTDPADGAAGYGSGSSIVGFESCDCGLARLNVAIGCLPAPFYVSFAWLPRLDH